MKFTGKRKKELTTLCGVTRMLPVERVYKDGEPFNPHVTYNWGYGGSTPYLLASNIIKDVLGDVDQNIADEYLYDVVSQLPDNWEIDTSSIEVWYKNKLKEEK